MRNPEINDKLKCIASPYDKDILKYFVITAVDKAQVVSVECSVGSEMFIKSKMRQHIAYHLANDDIAENSNNCGYCGGNTCSISLEQTSGSGPKKNYGPKSNCKYFVKFSLKPAEKSTKSSISTNRPVRCEHCDVVVWSYNLKPHYEHFHPRIVVPYCVPEQEITDLEAAYTPIV